MTLTGGKLGAAAWRKWSDFSIPLFPCSSNKAPLTKHGFKDAVVERQDVIKQFERFGEKAEYVGAAMGPVNDELGYFVLDFDLYKPEGKAEHDRLVEAGVVSDDTIIHRTVNGGLHYFYSYNPSKVEVGCPKPAKGVEVKGRGGYVIVPPSPGYGNAKSKTRTSIKVAPRAVLEYVKEAVKRGRSNSTDQLIARVVEADDFHDAATIIAARQQSRGYTRAQTMETLLEAFQASVARNAEHPRHERWLNIMKDDGKELSRIVNSAYSKYNPDAASSSMRDITTTDVAQNSATTRSSTEEEDDVAFPRSYLAGEADKEDDRQFILHPLIMKGDVVLVSADPKAGKTLFAVAASMAMACGIPFGGMRPVGAEGEEKALPVLYFALEGQGALKQRIAAWMKHTEESYNLNREAISLTVVEQHYDFTNPAHRAKVLEGIVKLNKQLLASYDCGIEMIVVDTLTKAMPGKDQNSVEDTSAVFSITNEIKQAGVDAAIMFIHHNNRSGGVRGSSNILAEPDTVLTLSKSEKEVDNRIETVAELKVHMARSIDDSFSQMYMFKSIDLGVNKQGITMRAPVFTPVVNTSDTKTVEEHYMKEEYNAKKAAFYNWLMENVTSGISHPIESIELQIASASERVKSYYSQVQLKVAKKNKATAWKLIAKENTEAGFIISVDSATKTVLLQLDLKKAV